MKAHISDAKKQEVTKLKELLLNNSIIGIVDLNGLPALQFQTLRSLLKDKVKILVTKKRLIKKAIEAIKDKKKNIEALEKDLEKCMPALLFTEEDPFKLAKILNNNKSAAPAKAGQTAPNDIIVPAGPTSFSPGPILGELGAAGIQSGVINGKIEIKADKLLVKRGEEIKQKQADILAKLGIHPMEIGLNLVSIYQNGNIFPADILFIDESEYLNNIKQAYSNSFGLAISISYLTKETITHLIKKAHLEAKALESNSDILTKDNVGKMLNKARAQASSLDSKVEIKEENKMEEEKKEEVEEKKESKLAEYSEEEAKKAQEIIESMKDKDIQKKSGG